MSDKSKAKTAFIKQCAQKAFQSYKKGLLTKPDARWEAYSMAKNSGCSNQEAIRAEKEFMVLVMRD